MISQLSHRLFYVSNTVGPMSNRGALKNLKANPLDRQSILLHWMTDLTLVIEARYWHGFSLVNQCTHLWPIVNQMKRNEED